MGLRFENGFGAALDVLDWTSLWLQSFTLFAFFGHCILTVFIHKLGSQT